MTDIILQIIGWTSIYILIILTIISSVGLDVDFDFDIPDEIDEIGLGKFISLKSFLSYLIGFSFSVKYLLSIDVNQLNAFILGNITGILFTYIYFLIGKLFKNLEETYEVDYEDFIGKTGVVYVTIPPNCTKSGSIYIEYRNKLDLIWVKTKDSVAIEPNQFVKITEYDKSTHTFYVTKI